MSDGRNSVSARSWNTYWQGTGNVGEFDIGGVAHPDVTAFWNGLFTKIASRRQPVRLLDVATGNGAILAVASSILDAETTTMTCVDISAAAIANIGQRFPTVTGVVADAVSIPLEGGQFDLVTSQFGVEYAGLAAIDESARMTCRGGLLVLMMHIVDGIMHHECQTNRVAIERLRAANFVPLALEYFKAGFAAVRGADRRAYDNAGVAFATAILAAEEILTEFGEGVAAGTVARLYSDVGSMHSDLPKYEPDEVLNWLDAVDGELQAYAERMSSMIDASLSASDFSKICERLEASGFSLDGSKTLLTKERDGSLAWLLIATRRHQA